MNKIILLTDDRTGCIRISNSIRRVSCIRPWFSIDSIGRDSIGRVLTVCIIPSGSCTRSFSTGTASSAAPRTSSVMTCGSPVKTSCQTSSRWVIDRGDQCWCFLGLLGFFGALWKFEETMRRRNRTEYILRYEIIDTNMRSFFLWIEASLLSNNNSTGAEALIICE